MFNDYMWQTYLKAGGKDIVQFFEDSLSNTISEDYAHKICELHSAYCPSTIISDSLSFELKELSNGFIDDDYGFLYGCIPIIEMFDDESGIENIIDSFYQGLDDCKTISEQRLFCKDNIKNLMTFFYDNLNEDGTMSDNQIFSEFCAAVPYYTTFLAMMVPDLFIPYYFQYNYNVLERIALEFEIELPPIPNKKDYKERLYHYGEICSVLYDFRTEHDMTPYELFAFLYDFAPKYIGGIDSYIIQDLPKAQSAYFIGGSKDDTFLVENSDAITFWQCNPETKAGDMIVMYLRTPISAVDSVWRSVSAGFNDPFFYYYRCTYIAKPEKIKRIPQKQLQQDEIFKDLPIVKKNMQGINGVELYPSKYNHLLDLAESSLPRLENIMDENPDGIAREKDVENKLVKPFLTRLGYSESEYQQQLRIRVGNNNWKEIPDFVIHPVVSSGHYSADFVLEAKYSITSRKKLEEDIKPQARSYAKLLGAKYSVIASKEGVWITHMSDDYSNDVLSFSWTELKSEDNFFDVFKLIGNGKM